MRPKSTDSVLREEGREGRVWGAAVARVRMGQRLEACGPQAVSAWSHQKLEEAGRILPWSPWRGSGPSKHESGIYTDIFLLFSSHPV